MRPLVTAVATSLLSELFYMQIWCGLVIPAWKNLHNRLLVVMFLLIVYLPVEHVELISVQLCLNRVLVILAMFELYFGVGAVVAEEGLNRGGNGRVVWHLREQTSSALPYALGSRTLHVVFLTEFLYVIIL